MPSYCGRASSSAVKAVDGTNSQGLAVNATTAVTVSHCSLDGADHHVVSRPSIAAVRTVSFNDVTYDIPYKEGDEYMPLILIVVIYVRRGCGRQRGSIQTMSGRTTDLRSRVIVLVNRTLKLPN